MARLLFCVFLFHCLAVSLGFPDQGRWSYTLNQRNNREYIGVPKSLYKGSKVLISVSCDSSLLTIGWVLRQAKCYDDYMEIKSVKDNTLQLFYDCPVYEENSNVRYLKFETSSYDCSNPTSLAVNSSFEDRLLNPQKCPYTKTSENDILTDATKENEEKEKTATPVSTDKAKPQSTGGNKQKRDTKSVVEGSVQQVNSKKSEVPNVKKEPVIKKSPDKGDENPTVVKTSSPTDSNQQKITEAAGSSTSKDVSSHAHVSSSKTKDTVAIVDQDGIYLLVVHIKSDLEPVNITIDIQMKGDYGYLSATDWPLLPFYGVMCGVYVIYAVVWLVVSALQWRDLLRIQFWIGGVIFIGLLEKAMFYAEYQSINSTGQSVQGAVLFAEMLSCMKRTLARMLVVIVSLGFGIVKPRLGPMLHRVVGMGALYFILATTEGCLRSIRSKYDQGNQKLMASVPLAVLDSAICWWIFSSLVQTTRTLCLRRNIVKLSLFRHFTNTLIFAVLASVIYMIWSVRNYKFVNCVTDWKELWVDDAYWHLLFSVLLLVIMILWRPTNNNQRYAFTPLLDAADEEDEEQDQAVTNDAFGGMKMRTSKNQSNSSPKQNEKNSKAEDDLKWVEENIPSSLSDTGLPSLLDSDEEIMTAKFERSKME